MIEEYPPLSVDELTELAEDHTRDAEYNQDSGVHDIAVCHWCGGSWPCSTVRLMAEVRRARGLYPQERA